MNSLFLKMGMIWSPNTIQCVHPCSAHELAFTPINKEAWPPLLNTPRELQVIESFPPLFL